MKPVRDSHCSFCGQAFGVTGWPRTCAGCAQISYKNPLPVAVILLPVDGGLLTVRRAIEPRKGELALPGGYIGVGESWQAAGAREVFEETGITIDPAEIGDFYTRSAPDGTVLVFGVARERRAAELPPFVPNEETMELTIVSGSPTLAFALHTEAAREYFARHTR
jgi:ADP-ribose pyrophosphatase YjhB (NUDIX family)